eukprot:gene4957-9917_t
MEGQINRSISTASFHHVDEEAVICGYLHKKTKDGRWQRRWFETNGHYLTYYKSKKMERLLAALSLPQVGDIRTIPIANDPENLGGLFELELKTRIYILRAKSDADAEIWVNTLKQIRDHDNSQVVIQNASQNVMHLKQSQKNNEDNLSKIRKAEATEITSWRKEDRNGCINCFLKIKLF